MKTALPLVIGCAAGALIASVFKNDPPEAPLPAATDEPTPSDEPLPSHRISKAFDYGKPLLIKQPSGREFRLIVHGLPGTALQYQWQDTAAHENHGSGELFQKERILSKSADKTQISTEGSSLRIHIETLQLAWSPHTQTSGWLYYLPEEVTITQ